MPFASDAQRKWFFANQGSNGSSGGSGSGSGSSSGGRDSDMGDYFVRMTEDEIQEANRRRNDDRLFGEWK